MEVSPPALMLVPGLWTLFLDPFISVHNLVVAGKRKICRIKSKNGQNWPYAALNRGTVNYFRSTEYEQFSISLTVVHLAKKHTGRIANILRLMSHYGGRGSNECPRIIWQTENLPRKILVDYCHPRDTYTVNWNIRWLMLQSRQNIR